MEDQKTQLMCKRLGQKLKMEEPMSQHTTFKIGGPAQYFYVASTTQELIQAVLTARELDVPVFILGGGSNILVGDKGIRGLVIRNATKYIRIKGIKYNKTGNTSKRVVFVEADSGVSVNALVRFTVDEGLSGLHMHLGLPGTVGGAIYMNSKWTKPEGYIGDAVYQVRLIDRNGEEVIVPQSYFRFAYDTSKLQETKEVVLSVVFSVSSADRDQLWNVANESIGYRRASQPQGVFSAGCTFRNLSPSDAVVFSTPSHTTSAGYLLDHAGLKGVSVGDAYISTDHANFIINKGRATASDVVKLIEIAREKVHTRFGVRLTEEIERIGDF